MTDKRLIDANALEKRMDEKVKELANGNGWHDHYVSGFDDAIAYVEAAPTIKVDGNTSDGYHTFNELYDHRAKLFSVVVRNYPDLCWKARLHHDGTMYEGMFIVGINTPNGQASYHYDIDPYWNMFDCKVLARAPEWDGHTPQQAIDRIAALETAAVPVVHGQWELYGADKRGRGGVFLCTACSRCRPTKSEYCPNCGAKMDGGAEK